MNDQATVGDIARLTGVSVRTLHHYDEIGLVVPRERSEAGYRLYGPSEVARLQEVLFFRELGFGLGEIKRLVERPDYDRATALQRQRRLLDTKAEHLLAMIDALDAAVEAERHGTPMSNEDMLGVFGDFDPAEHEAEARERWGDTDAYRESARRTARYGRADWEQMGRESAEIDQAFLALMAAGVPADSSEAMEIAERHRNHITKWFYECTSEIHVGLGQMYVADSRFTERIDRAGEGLAAYMSAAIEANAGR
jgi:DNA-binding transcriptional MerR regulator